MRIKNSVDPDQIYTVFKRDYRLQKSYMHSVLIRSNTASEASRYGTILFSKVRVQ